VYRAKVSNYCAFQALYFTDPSWMSALFMVSRLSSKFKPEKYTGCIT